MFTPPTLLGKTLDLGGLAGSIQLVRNLLLLAKQHISLVLKLTASGVIFAKLITHYIVFCTPESSGEKGSGGSTLNKLLLHQEYKVFALRLCNSGKINWYQTTSNFVQTLDIKQEPSCTSRDSQYSCNEVS